LVKVYIPRRIRERNRWLRSDGSPNFKDRIHRKPPEIEPVMIKDPPTISEQATVLNVCEVISKTGARIIPVTDPSKLLLGVVAGMDLIDYFGGGKLYDIVKKRYRGLIYPALNNIVRDIMRSDPIYVDIKTELEALLKTMVNFGLGALPVTNNEGKVIGLITEGELMKYIGHAKTGIKVSEVMSENVITLNYESNLGSAMKLMVTMGIRRVPIIRDNSVKGILTWKDIIDLFGKHKIFEMLKRYDFEEINQLPVTEVMEKKVGTIHPEADIGEAAEAMIGNGYDYLIVTKNGEMVGIITERDVLFGLVTR
jgi:CBS domain-containing protein